MEKIIFNMTSLLITRPEHDDTTYYLSCWSKEIIDLAKLKNIKVIDLNKKRANKKEVTSVITKEKPSFIIFNGHGDYDCVCGHNKEVLIKEGENEHLLKSKIIYSISCKSAKNLGSKSIIAGALDYLGYKENFYFVYDPKSMKYPLKDETAKLFLEPANEISIAILKGNSTKEAFERSKCLFEKNIQKLLTSDATQEGISYAKYLWWDMNNQIRLSNQEDISL